MSWSDGEKLLATGRPRLNKRADRATTAKGVCLQIKEEWAALTTEEIPTGACR